MRDIINDYTDIPCSGLAAPAWVQGVDYSDHLNYWKFGYDAIMLTDTSFLRNFNYHESTDTIETLDFKKMAEVVKGVVYYLMLV